MSSGKDSRKRLDKAQTEFLEQGWRMKLEGGTYEFPGKIILTHRERLLQIRADIPPCDSDEASDIALRTALHNLKEMVKAVSPTDVRLPTQEDRADFLHHRITVEKAELNVVIEDKIMKGEYDGRVMEWIKDRDKQKAKEDGNNEQEEDGQEGSGQDGTGLPIQYDQG